MKKIISLALSILVMMASATMAFAAEPVTTDIHTQYEVSAVGNEVMPFSTTSSISGYARYTVGSVIIPVESSGAGGAGATIVTSSSSTYATTVKIWEVDGPIFSKRLMGEAKISSNGTYYFENMTHYQPQYIVIEFDTIQTNIDVQAWIYG